MRIKNFVEKQTIETFRNSIEFDKEDMIWLRDEVFKEELKRYKRVWIKKVFFKYQPDDEYFRDDTLSFPLDEPLEIKREGEGEIE